MAFQPGANIERLVKDNERYHQAKVYEQKSKESLLVGRWHEKQYRVLNCATQVMQDRKVFHMETHGSGEMDAPQEMSLELSMAAKAVVLQRRAKLKSLFEREALQFEQELSAMGLALAKNNP
mmetsp:Transcript_33853/g.40943  ORF Transcript_33853/g.40943 Transcript_33853/m.40943 type:complete len:122 (-) Transcript_33853:493-858(-)|eukprot:CAMPEP_0197852232 /NCGR_PEP_ID=MMETSP1438-20131217/19985_1 /TAXON_ID=1461541 /ORGANISM="Pterosperma sp., Strain CCMP1384" /LENGTH=121 /DNA_ID=CAMNT_0043466161 /DNA_START=170 /DNA_END=535 /DNA_ORIENTATION=+